MAVEFASIQSSNWATAGSVTITKPTSLAVGDLMIAHIAYARTRTLTPKTGWYDLAGTVDLATTLDEGGGSNHQASVQYKIADSSDVAASDFSWTLSASDAIAGSIFRIVGQSTSNPVYTYSANAVLNSATPSFTGITPSVANSLLLMLGTTGNGTAGSSYAVATSNPTWTERLDNASGASRLRVGATASRPETTATGNGTWTIASGDATSDSTNFLIAISPEPDPVLTPSTITITVNVPTQGLTVPYSATPSAITVTVNVPNPTLTSTDNPWSNTSKNSSTWSNLDKS